MIKFIFIATIIVGMVSCKEKVAAPKVIGAISCRPDTTWLAQKVVTIHDTLYVICTYDSIPQSTVKGFRIWGGGWETMKWDMFEGGKTRDTIYKHEVIYY